MPKCMCKPHFSIWNFLHWPMGLTYTRTDLLYCRCQPISHLLQQLKSYSLVTVNEKLVSTMEGEDWRGRYHCTVFRQASILSGSGFNEFVVGLLLFQFFSWKRNELGINPAISRIFLKLSIISKQSKSAKKQYFEHVWAKFVQPSMLTWYQWTCSKRN